MIDCVGLELGLLIACLVASVAPRLGATKQGRKFGFLIFSLEPSVARLLGICITVAHGVLVVEAKGSVVQAQKVAFGLNRG